MSNSPSPDVCIALLHDEMVDKEGKLVSTSITTIDVHDIARSARTFGIRTTFVSHSSSIFRKLTRTLKSHWETGFGAQYNPNRKDALDYVQIVSSLDEAISQIDARCGQLPIVVATSAHEGGTRISFEKLRDEIHQSTRPYLIIFGTGWGMSKALLERANLFLDPIRGTADYNHLSVRSACAIILDRLLGRVN